MNENSNRNNLTWGLLLIAAGVLIFALQSLPGLEWGSLWPLVVIGAGGLFFVGMFVGGKSAGGLAIPGSIIMTVGLILGAQTIFDRWETWSYAWTGIVMAVGAGILIQSWWSDRPDLRKGGWDTLRTGVVLFLVFGLMMEFIFSATGISGMAGSLVWPALLALAALVQLGTRVYNLVARPESKGDNSLFGPILLLGIAGLAALTISGAIPALRLLSLLNLWPVLLIAAGLQMLVGRRAVWVGALLGVLVVASLFGLAIYGPQLGISTVPGWMFFGTDNGPGETVKGEGPVTDETRPVKGFDRVVVEGMGSLEVTQADTFSLVVSAEANLLPYITTEVRGDELVIGVKRGYNLQPGEEIRYKLSMPEVSKLEMAGLGNVTIPALQAGELELVASGAGNFTVNGLSARKLRVAVDGAGTITVGGQAETLDATLDGAGGLAAGDLKAAEVHVELSGVGNATVWAVERLNASIDGMGSVSYYGDPDVRKSVNGVGKVSGLGAK